MKLRRRSRRFIAGAIAAALWIVVGCTSVVRPPANVIDPQRVVLVFDARHRGLVLPRDDGTWVEYGFGEYAWYAELRDAWYRVFPAMLWPTRGTLGRRELPTADPAESIPWATLETLMVERKRALELRRELDARFAAHGERVVRNSAYGIDFVPDENGYWCFFNCSDAVTEWLRRLDCRVSWVPIRIDLAVAKSP